MRHDKTLTCGVFTGLHANKVNAAADGLANGLELEAKRLSCLVLFTNAFPSSTEIWYSKLGDKIRSSDNERLKWERFLEALAFMFASCWVHVDEVELQLALNGGLLREERERKKGGRDGSNYCAVRMGGGVPQG
jgi:hypothetical protein